MFKALIWILKLALALAVLFALCMAALFVIARVYPVPGGEYGAVIILGCQVKEDGTLSRQLEDRLALGLKLWQARPDSVVVVCGGQGINEPVTEAAAMKEYLTAHGVPERSILMETQSKNTLENIRLSKAMLGSIRKVAVVTSDYHVFRAGMIAEELGEKLEGIGSPTKRYFWINAFVREFIATLVSEMKKHLFVIATVTLMIVLAVIVKYLSAAL